MGVGRMLWFVRGGREHVFRLGVLGGLDDGIARPAAAGEVIELAVVARACWRVLSAGRWAGATRLVAALVAGRRLRLRRGRVRRRGQLRFAAACWCWSWLRR